MEVEGKLRRRRLARHLLSHRALPGIPHHPLAGVYYHLHGCQTCLLLMGLSHPTHLASQCILPYQVSW